MKIKEFIDNYENMVPLNLQDDWDNSGFQIGNRNLDLNGILLALDFSLEAVEFAMKNSLNLIFTHHPLFFGNIKNIDFMTKKGKAIELAVKNDILVYSSHTNLDYVEDGVSDSIANVIGLKNTIPIVTKDLIENSGLGKYSVVEDIEARDFIDSIKEKLGDTTIITYGDMEKRISKVGIIGGSGASEIQRAIELKLDLLITSDIKYHNAEFAVENNLLLADLGHYISEKFILDKLFKEFNKIDNIEIKKFYYDKSKRNFI